MEKIRNYKTYTDGMAKTFADKAWFVEKLPPHIDTLIDFADLLASLRSVNLD